MNGQRRRPTERRRERDGPSDGQSAQLAVRRNSSTASDVPELKNQRPWSYIRPDELPSSPNKLHAFYSNL